MSRPGRVVVAVLATAVATVTAVVLGASPASADPPASDWARVRMCESSGNYSINTGNGYFGAYQFNQGTWNSVGGTGRPDQASPAEQDYRALYLYRTRGWQPWECATNLGLQDDGDGASGEIPSYADSAYMGGGGATPPTTNYPTAPPSAPTSQPPAPSPTAPEVPQVPTPTGPITSPTGAFVAWPAQLFVGGQCDSRITAFQRRMNTFGYQIPTDGCFGPATARAVADEQRANNIPEYGVLGPYTWIAAWFGVDPDTDPTDPNSWPAAVYFPGQCDQALARWQRSEQAFGRSINTDGCYTGKTVTAVADVQRSNGIPEFSLVGPLTWMAAFSPDAQH